MPWLEVVAGTEDLRATAKTLPAASCLLVFDYGDGRSQNRLALLHLGRLVRLIHCSHIVLKAQCPRRGQISLLLHELSIAREL